MDPSRKWRNVTQHVTRGHVDPNMQCAAHCPRLRERCVRLGPPPQTAQQVRRSAVPPHVLRIARRWSLLGRCEHTARPPRMRHATGLPLLSTRTPLAPAHPECTAGHPQWRPELLTPHALAGVYVASPKRGIFKNGGGDTARQFQILEFLARHSVHSTLDTSPCRMHWHGGERWATGLDADR